MAIKSKKAKQKQRQQYFWGGVLILAAATVFSVVGYFALRPSDQLDAKLCPAAGPSGHVVVLVDTTDPLSFTQKQAFAVLFRGVVEKEVPEGHLLSVFVLGSDFTRTAEPVAELCNPGAGEGKSKFTANLDKLRLQYTRKFLDPLVQLSESLVAKQPAKASPVLEMLQLVSINGFKRADVQGEKRLVIFSDMLHNTDQYSMYRQGVDYASFAETAYGQKSRLEMPNVKVELHYIMNSPNVQTKRNLQFWGEHFNKAGARIVSVRPLEG